MHELPLITTVAAAFTAAWLLGLLTQRLRLSPIVGYLCAGVLIGPHTPGFVGDVGLAHQLAEVGVILLMFGVGLHFHLKDLLAVRGVAIPGAVGQSLVATLLGVVVFKALGLPTASGAVLGMAMAVASTVVLMRVLMDADALSTPAGHVAVGWLLVEDVFTVVVLVLIPVLGADAPEAGGAAGGLGLLASLGLALLKLGALVALVMLGGSRVIPWALVQVARLRSSELFTLTVLVFSIAIAAASAAFFGASMALGAFLAGMVVAQSPVSHQAAADALPLRDAFSVLFFVSVGMLFDPAFIVHEPLMILAALGIILVAKPLAALVIVALLGHSARTALTVALGLAQIGEFSFILSELARRHGLMPEAGHNVLVASAMISITLNPMLFRSLDRIEAGLRRRPRLWALLNGRAERRIQAMDAASAATSDGRTEAGRPAVVVGYGPVGRSVHRLLLDAGLEPVVIEMNMDTVAELRRQGHRAIFGDATREAVLEQAGVRRASHVVVTLPTAANRAAVVIAARTLNPEAHILVRAHYLRERGELEQAGATAAVFEEAEAAVGLARLVLIDTGANREVAERTVRDLRLHLIRENVTNLGSQRVRSVMMPWTRVHRLSRSASRGEVMAQVARQRFSRWPMVDPETGHPVGYLLTKDLIADGSADGDWTRLMRPLGSVGPEDDIASTLLRLQQEGATICVVEDGGIPVGLITIEDILEQVVGRIGDEDPRAPAATLCEAVLAGGVVLELAARTPERAIVELAAAISADRLPPAARVAERALARELELTTDLGVGVAIPHARCPDLGSPLVMIGRSPDGIAFSPSPAEPVRLIFLVVTPAEKPSVQLSLLGQLARIAGDASLRERLRGASSPSEILDAVAGADRARGRPGPVDSVPVPES